MVRNYKGKTNRANINEDIMRHALQQVLSKSMSQREATRVYGIKRQTLQSRIKKLLRITTVEDYLQHFDDDGYDSEQEEKGSKYATRKVFSSLQEDLLVKYIKKCSNMNYGMTYEQIRVLTYDYAKIIPDCKYPKRWDLQKKAAKPESTSLARGLGFNKVRVDEFFGNYKSVLKKYEFTSDRIFNLDETGITTVLSPPKVVAPKGKKQIGLVASAERGELVTFVGIISATRNALSPVYIFSKVSLNDWTSSNPGRTITVKHVPGLTKKPFLEAFSPLNITSSFEKPGIWPLNSLAFNDEDFDATLVYHKQSTAKPVNAQVNQKNDHEVAEVGDFRIQPPTSKEIVILPVNSEDETQCLSPESVRPLPKVEKQKKALRRPKANQGKSRVYTSTPEKRRLDEIEEEKMAKQKKKAEKQKEKLKKPSQVNVSPGVSVLIKMKKIKEAKGKVFDSSSSESSLSDINYGSDTNDNLSFRSLQEDDIVQINSFILVKFALKDTVMYYIGCVLTIVSENSYQVKYLRRRAKTTKFYFPRVDDIELCTRSDIYAKLTNPVKEGFVFNIFL
ncbi:hypothetical protein ILUMI_09403 [Ignelater luminosus]|uniref:HTH psq-type domain-containing protein n=1 Tax=Ignelater luminosus TaxID=2038154 RepID=A0A8K0D9A3_IGNLU|nr:hypothetical protein ILUMI_09403 [Ignelater luminosus]